MTLMGAGKCAAGGAAPTFTTTANMTHQTLGFSSPATFTNVNTGTGLVVVAVEFEAARLAFPVLR